MKKTFNLNISSKDALIVTDIQKDFLPGGALPVKQGDQIIPVLNEYIAIFKKANAKIIASRDWHPSNHMSFTAQGGPWPPHCVQETDGAQFHPDLQLPEGTLVVSKATDPSKEAYSVFDGTGLGEQLKSVGIMRVFIGGLATDYCVVNSVLDALKMGFEVAVLVDASRGINVNPDDTKKALDDMVQNSAVLVTLDDFPELDELVGVEHPVDVVGDKSLVRQYTKRKARMRPRGSYKQVRRERG